MCYGDSHVQNVDAPILLEKWCNERWSVIAPFRIIIIILSLSFRLQFDPIFKIRLIENVKFPYCFISIVLANWIEFHHNQRIMKSLMLLRDITLPSDEVCCCGNQSISDVCVNQFVGPPARSLLCSHFLYAEIGACGLWNFSCAVAQQKNPEKPLAKGIHSIAFNLSRARALLD